MSTTILETVNTVFDTIMRITAFAAFVVYGYFFLVFLPLIYTEMTLKNTKYKTINSWPWFIVKMFWTIVWGFWGFIILVLIDYMMFDYTFIPAILDLFGWSFPSPALWLP